MMAAPDCILLVLVWMLGRASPPSQLNVFRLRSLSCCFAYRQLLLLSTAQEQRHCRMMYGSMGLVFVINLKQHLICGVAKHRWKHKFKVPGNKEEVITSMGLGPRDLEKNVRRRQRSMDRSVLPPTAMTAWPTVYLILADDILLSWVWKPLHKRTPWLTHT